MVKYLSGRVKRTPQDQLKNDRYEYINLEQTEPNLADPPTDSNDIPPGSRFQLISIPGHPGRRYWVPIGGGLTEGAITVFDEGTQVSGFSSVTQFNFVGAAVTASVKVQSPSGHPGIAATVTVIPVTVGPEPPNIPQPNTGELWWESDTGDLYVYYDDGDSSQWVMANAGGQGQKGQKGEKGAIDEKGNKGDQGIQGIQGIQGVQGDKAGLEYKFSTQTNMTDPGQGFLKFNNATIGSVNAIAIDATNLDGVDFSDFINSFDSVNSTIKGHISVSSSVNADTTYSTFDITDITDNGGWLQLTVQNPNGSAPANDEQVVINISRTGDKGQKGEPGVQGDEGVQGIQGLQGDRSGLRYQFLSNTTTPLTDPGNGKFRFNNASVGSVTQIAIDNLTKEGTNVSSFINSWDESTDLNKGYFIINSNVNDDNTNVTFEITAVSQQSGFFIITVQDGVGILPSNEEECVINFSKTGDKGEKGIQGTASITNNADNRIITGSDTTAVLNAEQFFTFDANNLLTIKKSSTTADNSDFLSIRKSDNTELMAISKLGGIKDKDGELGTSGQLLSSTGTQLNWVDDQNTTYTLPDTGTDGTNFTDARGSATITLTGSDSTTDAVVITAGTNVKITDTGSGGFTINAQDTNDNTQLTTEEVQDIVGAMFSGNTETRISATYEDTDGTIDLVVDDMTANTTYTLPDTGTDGTNFTDARGSATITLTGTDSTTDSVVITAGTNVKITDTGSGGFTINAQDTNDNTQLTTEQVQDIIGAMVSGNTETRIAVTYNDTSGKLNFVVDDQSSDNNTTYDLLAVQTSGNNNDPAIKLDASSGDDDEVKLVGVSHSGITVTRADDSTINFDTSLQLLARQSTSGSNADPNLDLMGSASVALDTVKLVGGTNVNIERNTNGNEITFTAQNDNTQLSSEQVQDIVGAMFSGNTETNITATYQDSDGTIDLVADNDNTQLSKETVQDYIGEMLSGNTETRIAVTYDDTANKINFVVDDMTATGDNTTYDLVTSTSGSNIKLKLDASTGSSDDDDITITAGTNITLTDNSSGGFTIASTATLSGTIDEADKVKVNTSTENEYHNIAFVPKDTTSGSYQTLEIDSTDQRLAWNPNNNRLQSYDTQTYRLITWSGGSSGTAGQVLTSGGTGGWSWTTPSNLSGINAGASVSSSPPSSPQDGALWWDSDDGDLHIYYDDGSGSPSAQWVSIGGQGAKGDKGESANFTFVNVNSSPITREISSSDAGKFLSNNTGFAVNSNSGLSAGDAVTVFNSTTSSINITSGSGVTLRFAGSSLTGTRTLAPKGVATIICIASNEHIISGSGLL